MTGSTAEQVVLLDEAGRAIGVADKAEVHHAQTPLHLAFSCYLFDRAGRFLITQRAHHKPTWGGVWTNSCCGHPAPGEPIEEAVRRRVREELGLVLDDVRLVLPEFRYRAELDGVVEHEMCPVFVAVVEADPVPDPAEVAAFTWVQWPAFRREVLDGTRSISPWCALQVAALPEQPLDAGPATAGVLPPAARLG